jgi:hypothetical protein
MTRFPTFSKLSLSWLINAVIVLIALGVLLIVVVRWFPIGVDWQGTFHARDWADPYARRGFLNPPFTLFFLPHRFLPLEWGNAVNILLNVGVILFAIRRLGGGALAIVLTFTSPVFFDLCRTNNIDWLPLLGLALGPQLGPLLIICKPQSLGAVLLIWAKKDWRILLVPAGVLLLSLLIWGFWPARISVSSRLEVPYNFSIFPVGLPYGIYLLWKAWKTDDALLAAVATPLFAPYFAPYSLAGVLSVVTCRDRKAGLWLYLVIWGFFVIEARRQSFAGF